MKKIDIRNLANIGVADVDLYNTKQIKSSYKLKLRIGVFFDGTGNNRFNSDSVYYKYKNQFPIDEMNYPENKLTETATKRKIKSFVPESGSSYWNNYSNVALLHDLYQEKIEFDRTNNIANIQFRQYVEGIGTLDGEQDDFIGSGLAESDRGVIKRVNQCCENIVTQLLKKLTINKISLENLHIEEIKFDIFGFSRGAAAARHFCNEILKRKLITEKTKNPIGQLKFTEVPTPIPSIKDIQKKELDFILKEKIDATLQTSNTGSIMSVLFRNKLSIDYPVENVTVEFLGIFDTVISQLLEKMNIIDSAKTIKDNENIVKILSKPIILGTQTIIPPIDPVSSTLKALVPLAGEIIVDKLLKLNAEIADLPKINTELKHTSIKKIFHIMAMSDWRKNFPVTPVNDSENVRQLWMLGAHSDIGGGYSNILSENKVLHFMDMSLSATTEQKAKAEQERTDIRNWYINNYYCKDFEITWEEYHHILMIDQRTITTQKRIIVMPKDFMKTQLIKTEGKIEYQLLSYHYTLTSIRSQISNKLSVVSLKIMQYMATEYGNSPFVDYKQLSPPASNSFEYDLPEELGKYYETMKQIAETGWKKNAKGEIVVNRDLFLKYNDKERVYKIPDDIYKLINGKYVHLSANFNLRLSHEKLENALNEYIKLGTSEKLDSIRSLYPNEPQFNENENEKKIQPYKRLTYYPTLSSQDKVNSH